MGSRAKRRASPEHKVVVGSRFDRFKSQLTVICKHDWQPFGVPIETAALRRQTVRCPGCKTTKVIRTPIAKPKRGAA